MYSNTQKARLRPAATHAALKPVLAERDDLAGLHVAQEAGADDVEGARLAGHAVATSPDGRPGRPLEIGRSAPSASGRRPWGSRKATTRSLVMTTIENAPRRRGSTSAIASSMLLGRVGGDHRGDDLRVRGGAEA